MAELTKRHNYKSSKLVEIIAAVLLLYFLHTMLYTIMRLTSFKNMLAFYTNAKTAVAWTVVTIELIISVCLFISRTRMIGYILTAIYGITAIIIIIQTPGVPHDFGGITNHISAPMRYVLYGLIALLACLALVFTMIRRPEQRHSTSVPVIYT